jgi:FAD/FMN-containing dehydrogenase
MNNEAHNALFPKEAGDSSLDNCHVAVALEGVAEAVERMTDEIKEIGSRNGARSWVSYEEDADRILWKNYSNLPATLLSDYPNLVSLKLNYPISKYSDVINKTKAFLSEKQLKYILLSHAGSGVSLIHLLVSEIDGDADTRLIGVIERLLESCRIIGGNLVVQRARPPLKQRLPVWGLPGDEVELMKRIKKQMDPSGLFSPGRFVGGI